MNLQHIVWRILRSPILFSASALTCAALTEWKLSLSDRFSYFQLSACSAFKYFGERGLVSRYVNNCIHSQRGFVRNICWYISKAPMMWFDQAIYRQTWREIGFTETCRWAKESVLLQHIYLIANIVELDWDLLQICSIPIPTTMVVEYNQCLEVSAGLFS